MRKGSSGFEVAPFAVTLPQPVLLGRKHSSVALPELSQGTRVESFASVT